MMLKKILRLHCKKTLQLLDFLHPIIVVFIILKFSFYQTNKPTKAADSSDTKIPDSNI